MSLLNPIKVPEDILDYFLDGEREELDEDYAAVLLNEIRMFDIELATLFKRANEEYAAAQERIRHLELQLADTKIDVAAYERVVACLMKSKQDAMKNLLAAKTDLR